MMEITMQDNSEDPWQYSDDFAQTNLQLLEKELLCDIAFSFEEGKEVVRAHKNILSSRSPVFCTMFCGSLQETAAVIEIRDVDAIIFKQFLRYLYTKSCDVNADSVTYLLYVAKKYDVPSLQSICRIFLKKAINVENVCTILGQSLHFQEDDLQKECLNFISKKTTEVFKSASFLSLQTSIVKLIVREDTLNCNELNVYFALKAWAISACKQKGFDHTSTEMIRAEMGGLLRLVRFPNLCVEDFSKHVAKDVVLTQEEKLAIYQDIVLGESVSGYPSKLRRPPFVSMRIERFNIAKAQPWLHRNLTDGISFTVSKPCRLLGAILYRPLHEGKVMGQLSVYEENDLKIEKQESIYFAEEKITSDAFFSEVLLQPGKTYSIRQTFTGVGTYRGQDAQTSHMVHGVKINFTSHAVGSANGTTLFKGQICGIIIQVDIVDSDGSTEI